MDGYARILFSTLFELSRSYQGSCMGTTTSKLAEKIYAALDETPKLFPAKAVVACQGVEGAYSQIAAEKLFKVAVQPEKEIVMILVPSNIKNDILHALYKAVGLKTPGQGIAFAMPVSKVVGLSDSSPADKKAE